jgi:hypothetical protein
MPQPALLTLAVRLRGLRTDRWPEVRLTQGMLAKALGGSEPLAPATVASWENKNSPKLPPRERVTAYAQFFASRRSAADMPCLIPVADFTPEERAAYDELSEELLGLHAAARGPAADEEVVTRKSWHFPDNGPVTLVCGRLPRDEVAPLADRADPNYTELLSFTDLDALFELHGHIRAENPAMNVFYKTARYLVPDDLSGHIVLIGGVAWNALTKWFFTELTSIPVMQVEDPAVPTGEIFITRTEGAEQKFLPHWSDSDSSNLIEDAGLLMRMPNPLNSSRTLTMCNGIHSRGVLGAARSLTDARLRDSNERYIARTFRNANQFGIVMRIKVIDGHSMTPDFNIAGTVLYQWATAADGTPLSLAPGEAHR